MLSSRDSFYLSLQKRARPGVSDIGRTPRIAVGFGRWQRGWVALPCVMLICAFHCEILILISCVSGVTFTIYFLAHGVYRDAGHGRTLSLTLM